MGAWYASGQDIGGSAIAFGLLSISAVAARVYLARKRRLRLRGHDKLILLALVPVLALCVWNALAGLSTLLDGTNTSSIAFSFVRDDGRANDEGLAVMMLMHVVAALLLVNSSFDFYQRLFKWKRKSLVVRYPVLLAVAAYAATVAFMIRAVVVLAYPFGSETTAGFILAVAIVDFLVLLSLVLIPVFLRRRLPLDQLGSSKLVGMYLIAACLVAFATAFLVFSVYYLQNVFGTRNRNVFTTTREDVEAYLFTRYYYLGDLALWSSLTVTMWMIAACIPTFAPEIQQLSNQVPSIRQWPQQQYWQQPDPEHFPRPAQPMQQNAYI